MKVVQVWTAAELRNESEYAHDRAFSEWKQRQLDSLTLQDGATEETRTVISSVTTIAGLRFARLIERHLATKFRRLPERHATSRVGAIYFDEDLNAEIIKGLSGYVETARNVLGESSSDLAQLLLNTISKLDLSVSVPRENTIQLHDWWSTALEVWLPIEKARLTSVEQFHQDSDSVYTLDGISLPNTRLVA